MITLNPKGITFIEVIVAVAILAIGVVGVLQAFPFGLNLAKSSQMSTTASYLAQAKLEEMLGKAYGEIAIGTTTEDYSQIPGFSAYKRVVEINCLKTSDLSSANCDYDPVSDPYPMKKIESTVYWRSSFGLAEKNISLMSLISKK